jgi:hypothetical protein
MNSLTTTRSSLVATGLLFLTASLLGSVAISATDAAPTPTPVLLAKTEAPAPSPAPTPWTRRTMPDELFNIALVLADIDPAAGAPLPHGLEKAIDDVRAFLPYHSFRLVDAGLVRTDRGGHVTLKGPGDVQWSADFELGDMSDAGLLIDRFVLQPAQPQNSARAGTLRGSFRIKRGETVVVGSAELADAQKAVIVLFTAAP